MTASIRRAHRSDLDAVYDVCARTAAAGKDATGLLADPRLPGHVFAAPYLLFEPDFAFVVEDGDGVGGYILGALDTVALAELLERDWWPDLRRRYPLTADVGGLDGLFVGLIHQPSRADPVLLADYPSHLHIDLLPRLQGAGWGRRLTNTLCDALRAAGSCGAHLGVSTYNEHAIGFDRALGLDQLGETPDVITFGRRLAGAP